MSVESSLVERQRLEGKTRLVTARRAQQSPTDSRGYRTAEVVGALGLEGALRYDRL